ncbi:MAG: LysM peptidoglycan-binding domain-containing protein [Firmicutes bacterium]|nr:LysM peptidoglycan-binding domain-containing protein [Bacillota bacterium]
MASNLSQQVNIVLRPSDTLFGLASIFNVSVNEILAANPGIVDANVVFVGQIVTIPTAPPVGPNPGFNPAQHLVRSGDTLFFIAQQYGLTLDLLIAGNPQIPNPNVIQVTQVINLPVTPPLPPDLPNTVPLYVTGGETLTSIAQRTGVTVADILAVNPQIEDPNLIRVGQIINIPTGEVEIPERALNIVVRPGDTLFQLAQVFGVTVEDILEVNPGITDPDEIQPGLIVSIHAEPPVGPDPGFAFAQHLVRSGESLFSIAQQYGISIDALIDVNPQIEDSSQVFVNQVINLPVTPPLPLGLIGAVQVYVSAGETLTSIARRFDVNLNDLIAANPQIEDHNFIFAGQIINVPVV